MTVQEVFKPLQYSLVNFLLELFWYEKYNACCFWIDNDVVLSAEKGQLQCLEKQHLLSFWEMGKKKKP